MELCFLSSLTSSEWAAWVQAIGSIVAIVASVLVVRHGHNLSVARLEKERTSSRVVSKEHWARALRRANEVCLGTIENAEAMRGGDTYFRSALANLRTILDVMGRRDLNVLDRYDDLKFVISGMGAVSGSIAHLEKLLTEHATHSQWHTRYMTAMGGIPEQLVLCASKLEES